jgi:NTE family protein
MNFLPSIFSFLIFLMTFPPLLPAQEDKPVETGLVLSGGGALGLAHIGVLQYLEEINFPIDRIGGTSMGGIVGGLYSLGYSADELADIVVLQDWDLLLSNYYDRQMASLEAREKQDRFLISLKREKDKISLGSALINGINIYLLLKELTYPFSPDQNFEDFPIPFYCISVDLANRKPIILDQGELAEALLATMAIPGVFAPVERGDQLLVDGGLLNNYPVKEMRERGAGRVLGVRFNYGETHGLESDLFSILNRSYDVLMQYARPQFEGKADIEIEIPVEDLSFSDFQKADSLIRRGYLAAKKQHEKLIQWSHPKPDSADHSFPTVTPEAFDSLFSLRSIQITGNERVPRSFIQQTLGISTRQPCTYKDIQKAIQRLQASDEFKRIFFRIADGITGKSLLINLEEKPNTLLNVGLRYDSDFGASILLNPQVKDILASGSLLKVAIRLNNNPYLLLDYQFSAEGKFTPFLNLLMSGEDYFTYNELGSLSSTRQFNQFSPSLGIQWTPSAALRAKVGYQWQWYGFTTDFRQFILDDLEKDLSIFYGRIETDKLDRAVFPKKGMRAKLEAKLISEDFWDEDTSPEGWFYLKAENYTPLFGGLTFFSALQAGYSSGFIDEQYRFFTGGLSDHLRSNLFIQAGEPLMSRGDLKAISLRGHLRKDWQETHHIWLGYSISSVAPQVSDLPDLPLAEGLFAGYGYSTSLGPLEAIIAVPLDDDRFEFLIRAGFEF